MEAQADQHAKDAASCSKSAYNCFEGHPGVLSKKNGGILYASVVCINIVLRSTFALYK